MWNHMLNRLKVSTETLFVLEDGCKNKQHRQLLHQSNNRKDTEDTAVTEFTSSVNVPTIVSEVYYNFKHCNLSIYVLLCCITFHIHKVTFFFFRTADIVDNQAHSLILILITN